MKRTCRSNAFLHRKLLTLCWQVSGLSGVLWELATDRHRLVRKTGLLDAAICTPESVKGWIDELTGRNGPGGLAIRWILVKEGFPLLTEDQLAGLTCAVQLPDWILQCWRELPEGYLPHRVVSGMTVVQAELNEWPEYTESGTGFCLFMEGRAHVIGHGGGECFNRVSRYDLRMPGSGSMVNPDWLLQTRVLFQNRTGAELKRILLAEPSGLEDQSVRELPFELIAERLPPRWPRRGDPQLEASMIFLHTCAAGSTNCQEGVLDMPLISQRKRQQARNNHLQIAVCLLLAGWVFLILSACQHVGQPEETEVVPASEMLRYQERLEGYRKRWDEKAALDDHRFRPMRTIGSIARTKPESVSLARIHIQPESPSRPESLTVEGRISSENPSRVFKGWIQELELQREIRKVGNLRLEREDGQLRFRMQAWPVEGRNL